MNIPALLFFAVIITMGGLFFILCCIEDRKRLRNGAPEDHKREDLAYGDDWMGLCKGCGKYYHHDFLDIVFQKWILDDGSSTTGCCVGRQCKECQKNHIGDPGTVHSSDYFDKDNNMILPGEVMAYRSSR